MMIFKPENHFKSTLISAWSWQEGWKANNTNFCFSSGLQKLRPWAHHGHPGPDCPLQLPRQLSQRWGGAVCGPVGEAGQWHAHIHLVISFFHVKHDSCCHVFLAPLHYIAQVWQLPHSLLHWLPGPGHQQLPHCQGGPRQQEGARGGQPQPHQHPGGGPGLVQLQGDPPQQTPRPGGAGQCEFQSELQYLMIGWRRLSGGFKKNPISGLWEKSSLVFFSLVC